ncbi:putative histone acetyltransferase 1 [Blattamonas nauphoetae]|uniref:Histone acetyltransferase 1 n=1 Tax=Blattamonas nauphoetae TaxID=2049346 RepID=A0ABQ9X235_9EUKA|nr:putative histone acetyltransferase 1 [Blattamonas nauphoetae]
MPCPPHNPNESSSTPLGNAIFQIYCTPFPDPDMKVFRKNLMAMSFFFVNNASYLDEDDANWDVYLMYKKTNKRGDGSNPPRVDFRIVGYATVYRFFHFPNSSLWRISSRLSTIPPSGSCHLSYRYGVITLKEEQCHSDYRRAAVSSFRQNEAVAPFSNLIISDIQSKVPIIKEQLRRCRFIFRWRVLDQKNAELVKDFRVDVKRDLYLKHEEELAGLEQSERTTKLDLLYQIQVTEMRMASSCFEKHLDFIEQGVWNPPDE